MSWKTWQRAAGTETTWTEPPHGDRQHSTLHIATAGQPENCLYKKVQWSSLTNVSCYSSSSDNHQRMTMKNERVWYNNQDDGSDRLSGGWKAITGVYIENVFPQHALTWRWTKHHKHIFTIMSNSSLRLKKQLRCRQTVQFKKRRFVAGLFL